MPILGAVVEASERVPVPPDAPAVGGGAITLLPSDAPMPLRLPRGLPPAELAAALGGGGTTLAGNDDDDEEAEPPVPFVFTVGGGGTTSVEPKILPIRLLM